MRGCGALLALFPVALVSSLEAVPAQEAVFESVQRRSRPEFDPIGFEIDRLFSGVVALAGDGPPPDPEEPRGPLSSFFALPELELDFVHTDNLFRTPTDERSDGILIARPSLRVESDWDNHGLRFLAEAQIGRHDRNPTEDFEDYKLEAEGRLTIGEFSTASGFAGVEHGHEERGSVDDPGAAFGPTVFDVHRVNLGFEHRVPDGVLVRPYVGLSRFRYDDNGAIDNADRWRDEYEFRLRMGYEFTPGTVAFVQPRYTTIDYRERLDRNGLQRNTQLFEVLAGVTWDASSVTFFEAGVGVMSSNFDEPRFADETRPSANLKMTWNATPLITVNASLDQTFNPIATVDAAGTINTAFEASVDWEAVYNLILGIEYGYLNEEFIDATPARSRSTNFIAANARWLINEFLFTSGEVSRESRSGDLPLDALEENRILARIGVQL
jgi:hypothetical protein